MGDDRIPTVQVLIGERRINWCGSDWREQNRDFLGFIDPEYFATLATNYLDPISASVDRYASLQLRLLRDHAAETLFALIASTIQAPHASVIWLTEYRNHELRAVIRSIQEGISLETLHGPQVLSWDGWARSLFKETIKSSESNLDDFVSLEGDFWRRLAGEFSNEDMVREYNSIKHGLRVAAHGPPKLIMSETMPASGTVPQEVSFESSDPGHSWYVTRQIQSCDPPAVRLERRTRMWKQSSLAQQVLLISNSINNVLGWLRVANGHDRSSQVRVANDRSLYRTCWESPLGIVNLTIRGPLLGGGADQRGTLASSEQNPH